MRAKQIVLGSGLVGILLLAGCTKEPKGQVVAIVNGDEISVAEMSAELKGVPVADNVDRKMLRKQLLQSMIDRKLMAQKARQQGIDKSDDYLLKKKSGEEDILAGMLGHIIAQTVPLPDEHEIQAYISSHPNEFAQRQRLVLDQLSFTPPKDRRKLDGLRDAHTLAAAAAALQAAGIPFLQEKGTIDSGKTDPKLIDAIVQAPPGEPILLPRGDQLVVGVITAREPTPPTDNDTHLFAARAVRLASLVRESEAQVGRARSSATISYKLPGYDPAEFAKKKK